MAFDLPVPRRRISSALTPVYRVLPLMMMAMPVLLLAQTLSRPGRAPPPVASVAMVIALGLAAGALVWWATRGLKHVELDARALYVSGAGREVTIPLSEVLDVSMQRLGKTQAVVLSLRAETAVGRKVVFLPPLMVTGAFVEPPIVDELRRAVERAGVDAQFAGGFIGR